MVQPSFDRLRLLLESGDALTGPSETHGLLTGLLCGQHIPGPNDWLPLIFGDDYVMQAKSAVAGMMALMFQMGKQLQGEDALDFSLGLPPDDTPLPQRVDALAAWCQGFLLGFGLSTRQVPPGDTREVLRDFEAIGQADLETGVDGAAPEKEFMEVQEFVRMGIHLIYAELHPATGKKA